jgi:hypothetical protein
MNKSMEFPVVSAVFRERKTHPCLFEKGAAPLWNAAPVRDK